MRHFALLILISLLLGSCSDAGLGYDSPLYDMKSSVSPAGEGEVNPPFGTYEEGKEITVEAVDTQPSDTVRFLRWTGDTTSTDNPLTFKINRDMNLTANFGVPDYIFRMTATDGVNPQMHVAFGVEEGATAGFDDGIDRDLPPPPPDNGFDVRFVIPDYGLAEDYRSFDKDSLSWTLQIQSELQDDVTLQWDYSDKLYFSSMRLTDSATEPSFSIDLKSQTSFQITEDTQTTLYIIAER